MNFEALKKSNEHESVIMTNFRAFEKSNEREVAIKIVENVEDNMEEILQEYQILSDHCLHPNIPLLYGAFRSIKLSGINHPISHINL